MRVCMCCHILHVHPILTYRVYQLYDTQQHVSLTSVLSLPSKIQSFSKQLLQRWSQNKKRVVVSLVVLRMAPSAIGVQ